MGNCLKTQLQGTVNNEDLDYLGYGKAYYMPNVAEQQLVLYGTGKVKLQNAVFTSGGSSEMNLSTSSPTTIDGSTMTITDSSKPVTILFPKYDITLFGDYRCKVDINYFKYSSYLNNVLIRGSITGDIAAFGNCTAITIMQLQQSNLNGDISSLYKFVNATSINFSDTSVSGDLVDLADAMALRRTSGKLLVTCSNYIKLNGAAIASGTVKYIKFGSSLPSGAEYTGTGYAIYATNPDA